VAEVTSTDRATGVSPRQAGRQIRQMDPKMEIAPQSIGAEFSMAAAMISPKNFP
jgi:hypothetical protein